MLLPICYDDPVNEYRKLLEDVTLWDVSVERRGFGAGRRVRPCEPGHLSRSDEGRADAGSVRASHRSVEAS
jgi:hypothetical protein